MRKSVLNKVTPCQSNLTYGTYCENKVNICLNKTCSSHGYCIVVNETMPSCKCYFGYQGNVCDQEDSSKKISKGVQTTSVIIAFIVLGLTVFIILTNDGWNLLIGRMRRRYRNAQPQPKMRRFRYYPASEIAPPTNYRLANI